MATRERRIVVLASEQVGPEAAKEWLRTDERGTFETMARELLLSTAETVAELQLSEAEVDRQIALALALAAVEALLKRAGEGR